MREECVWIIMEKVFLFYGVHSTKWHAVISNAALMKRQ